MSFQVETQYSKIQKKNTFSPSFWAIGRLGQDTNFSNQSNRFSEHIHFTHFMRVTLIGSAD